MECIDRALQTLGEGVQPAFYHQIEKKHNLPREQFVTKPKVIIEYLDELLGPNGSAVLERLIVREVRKAFGLKDERNLPLSNIIEDAKRKFMDVSEVSD
ncbi:MAG: hypothetical protein ACHQ1H_03395 [Nitrososphaerales archaeon]